MATSKMIDMAARRPSRPVVPKGEGQAAEAALYRPRAAEDVEAAERAKSLRQAIRMALGLHDCPRLNRCEVHGQDWCDCHPCYDPAHAEHAGLAGETLLALGLAEGSRDPERTCTSCGKFRPRALFKSDRYPTCKVCQGKVAERGEEVAGDGGA